jgi:PhzF family phenazine biosynthesis protein
MKLSIYQIDAFTSRLFGGNPAAVVLLQDELPTATLQAIAAENNLSETAFVLPQDDHYGLRWFTPTMEIDLCGHATLATGFVLFETGAVEGDSVRFQTLSGTLTVSRSDELLSLNFPARPAAAAECTERLVAALGARPSSVMKSRDLMAVFDSEEQVANLAPDFSRIAGLDEFAVIVTAPGRDVDFVSRFFAPKAGIDEDPVTGSAHCTLAPFWASTLGKARLHAHQLSARGGELFCEVRESRVMISGNAVEYLRGQILIDEDR